jgi:hypothetical protein
MPRPLDTGQQAALSATVINPAIFFYGLFNDGPVRVWSGIGSITWGGFTWLGIGTFGSISTIEEGTNILARGITVTFSGFDNSFLSEVLGQFKIGNPCTVYLGLFDSTRTLIGTPIIMWAGRLDQPVVFTDAQTASININCENRLNDMNVAVDRRYTDADQQLDFPGDTGMSRVLAIQNVTIYWGTTANKTNLV